MLCGRGCKLKNVLVSPLILDQNNALKIFIVKRNTVLEICKELLSGTFTEVDGGSAIKNIIDTLGLGELQLDYISEKTTAKSIKNYILIREIKFRVVVFEVFSARI